MCLPKAEILTSFSSGNSEFYRETWVFLQLLLWKSLRCTGKQEVEGLFVPDRHSKWILTCPVVSRCRVITYECCPGYEKIPGEKGCPAGKSSTPQTSSWSSPAVILIHRDMISHIKPFHSGHGSVSVKCTGFNDLTHFQKLHWTPLHRSIAVHPVVSICNCN